MPIYEYYCVNCNTIFKFFSRRINTIKRPSCPKCNKTYLDKVVSEFAFLKGVKEDNDIKIPDLDEKKLEKAMSLIEREAKYFNDEDPRQAAQFMRKICDTTGLNFGSNIEEALKRLEAGEDPEKIEEDMGYILNEEDLFKSSKKKYKRYKKKPPLHDDNLYIL